jgi:hypothetical protein
VIRGVAIAVTLIAALAAPALIAAADPTPPPRTLTCAERYPADGPAGIDLRLGCIASELVGQYTGDHPGDPAPISTYLGPLLVLVGGFALLFLMFRAGLAKGSRRLAPAVPSAYWLCPVCHSVNDPTRAACYSCGRPLSPEAAILPADERPEMVQRFGGDRKSGPD